MGLFLLVAMLVIAKTIKHDVKSNTFDAHIASEGPLIIRSEVNAAQGLNHRWRRGDTVELRQNGRTSTYRYTSNSDFIMVGSPGNAGGGGSQAGQAVARADRSAGVVLRVADWVVPRIPI